ncbi:unnamed protein product [Absidia cylindrospora]
MKAGFTVMALGAISEKEGLNVKIVPVDLNYLRPHRFLSWTLVYYGIPLKLIKNSSNNIGKTVMHNGKLLGE